MDIVKTLTQQQEDKLKREADRRSNINEQATMWRKERELWKEEDKRIQDKIKQINRENQEFLKMQEDLKKN